MIGLLRLLQFVERGGVFALPLEPRIQPRHGLGFRAAGAFDAERVAVILAARPRYPPAITLRCFDTVVHKPNLDGLIASSMGSTRLSSIASATSCAVSGASKTPLR